MNDWKWEDYDFDYGNAEPLELSSLQATAAGCSHEWKATLLIFSSVYDCVKCGKKKEDQ